jgi:hypothetical protein
VTANELVIIEVSFGLNLLGVKMTEPPPGNLVQFELPENQRPPEYSESRDLRPASYVAYINSQLGSTNYPLVVLTATCQQQTMCYVYSQLRLLYEFTREGDSTFYSGGQRIAMAEECGYGQILEVTPDRHLDFSFSAAEPLFYAFKQQLPIDNVGYGVIQCRWVDSAAAVVKLNALICGGAQGGQP